jgi:hypothetical protein
MRKTNKEEKERLNKANEIYVVIFPCILPLYLARWCSCNKLIIHFIFFHAARGYAANI